MSERVRIRMLCDRGFHNWALLPTIYVGMGSKPWCGWVYAVWLDGRVGFARY